MKTRTLSVVLLAVLLALPLIADDEPRPAPPELPVDPATLSLEEVVQRGFVSELKDRIAAGTAAINARVQDKHRPLLHIAVESGQLAMAEYLLSEKADVDAFDSRPNLFLGGTALHVAAALGKVDMVKALTGYSANPNAFNKDLFPGAPLSAAMGDRSSLKGKPHSVIEKDLEARKEIVTILIEKGASLYEPYPPLYTAAAKAHPDLVRHLVKSKLDVDLGISNSIGQQDSPIFRAVGSKVYAPVKNETDIPDVFHEAGNPEIVEILLKAGAKKNSVNLEFMSPLSLAKSVLKGLEAQTPRDEALQLQIDQQRKVIQLLE